MKKIFISGSRNNFSYLPNEVIHLLEYYIKHGYIFLLGDAPNGIDYLVQQFLFKKKYEKVIIYCMKGNCRFKKVLFSWKIVEVPGDFLNKYNFFVEKDIRMVKDCDIGVVIRDGKSNGSRNNIKRLCDLKKKCIVFYKGRPKIFSRLEDCKIKKIALKDDKLFTLKSLFN